MKNIKKPLDNSCCWPGDHEPWQNPCGGPIAIIGHSGSGKSTLLSLIGGLAAPDSGSVAIGGTVLSSISDQELSKLRNQKIRFIYQFASLIPSLTSLENILLPTAFGKSSSSHEAYARELLDMVKLTDKGKSYPRSLSDLGSFNGSKKDA